MYHNTIHHEEMAALISASSMRGRSRSRSARGRKRQMVSASRSLSRSSQNNLMRTWPSRQSWSSGLADPFPARTVALLRYSANISLDPTSVLAKRHAFRCNSIFDPDATGVGHQPYGHDQYQAIYKNYRVLSSTCTVTNASAGSNNIMGVTLRSTQSENADPELAREIKGTRYTCLASTQNPHKVQQTFRLRDFPDHDGYGAEFGSNPTEAAYFHVWAAPNGAADPSELALAVDIVYIVEMFEPLLLGVS